MQTIDYCDIYITGVRLADGQWTDDSDTVLDDMQSCLSEIARFNYISISLNMAQVYNVRLASRSYNSMMAYIKGIHYKSKSFFNQTELVELNNKISVALSYIYGLTFQAIEIRCNKKYKWEEE